MNKYSNNPTQLWQCQPVQGLTMSAAELRKRTTKFERTIRWRNSREYLGALVAAVAFGSFLIETHDLLFRIAFGVCLAGLAYVVLQLHRKGAAKTSPQTMGALPWLQFYRSELERQRDLVANVWPWYLAPLVPGLAVYTVAYARALPYPANLIAPALLDAFVAAVFFLIWKLNLRAARSLQRTIDELNALETQN